MRLSYDHNSSELKVKVIDTGIGIKDEDKLKLFSIFGKLEVSAYINTSGIGLGLSICKQIVEAFNGRIFLDQNHQGKGSCFTFTVKCK